MNKSTNAPRIKSKLDVTTAKTQPDTYTAADISEMCNHNGWQWVMAGSRHFSPDRFFVKLWAENYPETCMVDMEGESLPAALHAAKNFVASTSPSEYRSQYPGWGRY